MLIANCKSVKSSYHSIKSTKSFEIHNCYTNLIINAKQHTCGNLLFIVSWVGRIEMIINSDHADGPIQLTISHQCEKWVCFHLPLSLPTHRLCSFCSFDARSIAHLKLKRFSSRFSFYRSFGKRLLNWEWRWQEWTKLVWNQRE